uniref:Uncharacterized protein n=1 Tax=Arundo donax TaxID=35708 RepID=A0A0A9F0L7_ARUDO
MLYPLILSNLHTTHVKSCTFALSKIKEIKTICTITAHHINHRTSYQSCCASNKYAKESRSHFRKDEILLTVLNEPKK